MNFFQTIYIKPYDRTRRHVNPATATHADAKRRTAARSLTFPRATTTTTKNETRQQRTSANTQKTAAVVALLFILSLGDREIPNTVRPPQTHRGIYLFTLSLSSVSATLEYVAICSALRVRHIYVRPLRAVKSHTRVVLCCAPLFSCSNSYCVCVCAVQVCVCMRMCSYVLREAREENQPALSRIWGTPSQCFGDVEPVTSHVLL